MKKYMLLGDSLEVLKGLPDNSINAVVTDPPYGLSFMGKKWDYDVPSVELWIECLRVLKPGGHLLSFGGTRTYHRMVVNIEDAGFEIRDQIQWIYGSGFPKSLNIKEGEFKGWGTALKPANEPIVLARKPLDGTVYNNIEKWGVGGLNIEASRIEAAITDDGTNRSRKNGAGMFHNTEAGTHTAPGSAGRWPANVLFDEEAAVVLDEQSGNRPGCKSPSKAKPESKFRPGQGNYQPQGPIYPDSGGASRFFYVAKASKRERNAGLEGMEKKAQGTYGKFAGDGRGRQTEHQPTENFHPTVKPIKLMEYLCKLITPPGGIVLDPFMGTGSTGVAALKLGFSFMGIEREPEYFEIAKKRIENISKVDSPEESAVPEEESEG